MLREVI